MTEHAAVSTVDAAGRHDSASTEPTCDLQDPALTKNHKTSSEGSWMICIHEYSALLLPPRSFAGEVCCPPFPDLIFAAHTPF